MPTLREIDSNYGVVTFLIAVEKITTSTYLL